MRREERVAVQGPVKEQQPDGMSHRGGGGGKYRKLNPEEGIFMESLDILRVRHGGCPTGGAGGRALTAPGAWGTGGGRGDRIRMPRGRRSFGGAGRSHARSGLTGAGAHGRGSGGGRHIPTTRLGPGHGHVRRLCGAPHTPRHPHTPTHACHGCRDPRQRLPPKRQGPALPCPMADGPACPRGRVRSCTGACPKLRRKVTHLILRSIPSGP